MKILITGSTGQLGSDCRWVLGVRHELIPLPEETLDITDRRAVMAAVRRHRPDLILNCAAFTAVDAAEVERERAYQVNVLGPRNLAEAAARQGARLVHLSTDYVFGGDRTPPRPYIEEDEPGPVSHYGRTKLLGEQAVREVLSDSVIVRTSWLYGIHGQNFLKTMLRLARRRPPQPLRVVHDQFGSLTWSYRLAEQLAKLIEADGRGLYHATAEGVCTWYEAAAAFLELMGVEHTLIPITTAEFPTPAVRPRNSILENRRLKEADLNLMRPWREDLARFAARHRETLLTQTAPPGG
ncbi:MAG: dTDP-4-dehydrorhamnose reductase [Deltaproteobacteria bacterium]|nr:dTDP-4-dehydrorhamnose reductase [Deltaproteobacteria bacterium]